MLAAVLNGEWTQGAQPLGIRCSDCEFTSDELLAVIDHENAEH